MLRVECRVRAATETDIPRIIEMGRPFWEQTQYRETPYDPDSMDHFCRVMLHSELLLVAQDGMDGKVIGAVGGVSGPLYANMDVKVGSELFWWVEPGYRNGGAGKLLLLEIEKAAARAGVTYWAMMFLSGAGDPERAANIYLANGYQRAEMTFMKRLSWPPSPEPQSPPQA
jgi:GNAT superfamily N-acetyltransferase